MMALDRHLLSIFFPGTILHPYLTTNIQFSFDLLPTPTSIGRKAKPVLIRSPRRDRKYWPGE